MEKLDFGFGTPWGFNELFKKMYTPSLSFQEKCTSLPYAPVLGLDSLIQHTKDLTSTLSTNYRPYKYVIITNGATSAINGTLRYLAKTEKEIATLDFGYPYYGDMISKAGLNREVLDHKNTLNLDFNSKWILLDSPHNPSGNVYALDKPEKSIIWDATYHTTTYLNRSEFAIRPKNPEIIIGSYGKMYGITGIRLGFWASNNEEMFKAISHDLLMENATPSHLSQIMMEDILNNKSVANLIDASKIYLDCNKTELSKLEKITGTPVNKNGMFYFFEADEKLAKLFEKCGIIYTRFDNNGLFIRLNAFQTVTNIRELLYRIQKEDGA